MKNKLRYFLSILNHHLNPYQYNEKYYTDTFLVNSPYNTNYEPKLINRVIYVFWTGNNPLTENRLKGLEVLKSLAGVKIELITPDNLKDFILPDYPLHPAYEYLSFVHRSDYLRCYFMHHYGGGYSDIKPCQYSWLPMFEKLETSTAWLISYPELRKKDLGAWQLHRARNHMIRYLSQITGNCCYICRPYSPLTTEWYTELHRRLDEKYELVKENAGNIWGDNEGYPFVWTELWGDIYHPLVLKYMKFTLKDKRLRPVLVDYR